MPVMTLNEFISIAIRDEDTGESFYEAIASLRSGEMKSVFSKMAGQEKMHGLRFRKMLEELGTHKPQERHPGEYEGYLRALIEMRAFTDPAKAAEKARHLKSDHEAAEIALRMEKDTLLFYMELMKFLPDTQHAYIKDIIDEEHMHVSTLTQLLHKLA